MKAADIDPRPEERQNCFTISDKSRSIGNSVLLAVEAWRSGRLHWQSYEKLLQIS
jgi:xanthine dehydrogenase accessory factor